MRRFLLLIVALLAYGSLYPWRFEFTAAAGNPFAVLLHGWPAEWTWQVFRDTVLNVFIYIPLGVAATLTFRRKYSRGKAAALAVVFGFFFSVTMEVLQVYVPGRDSSLADVLTNVIGSAVGAVFAIGFEAGLIRLCEYRPSPLRPAAVLLLLLWAVIQFYPFFPSVSFAHLRREWFYLRQFQTFTMLETWENCVEWFAVGLALQTVFARMRSVWLAIAMLSIPAQMFIADRFATVPEIAGALAALALWHFVRAESRPRWCVGLLGSAIVLGQLSPFYFLAVPQPFSWAPFQATLMSNRLFALIVITRKAFDYGAIIWALRYAGMPFLWAGLIVTAALSVTEAIQTYLPGRTPEITDPLLALLMMLVLSAMSRSASTQPGKKAI